MNQSTRRELLKAAAVAPFAEMATAAARQSAGRPKSKRDLMQAVLQMEARPGYVPAAFFMHFGVTGDAAVKAHLDHFPGNRNGLCEDPDGRAVVAR